jgi:A/G-specific adenine glycosylase
LAHAPQDIVLKLWEGLGYYSRAKNLQKAAQKIMHCYGGNLPTDYEQLLSLPGIGPYTAAAIVSIAFNIPKAAVDGNVLRVISRLTASEKDIADPKIRKEIEVELQKIIPKNAAGDFTQALMELGAVVCLPNGEPVCCECPLVNMCKAYEINLQAKLPIKSKKKKRKIVHRTILVVNDGKEIAIRKREGRGLLSELWELPGIEGKIGEKEAEEWLVENHLEGSQIKRISDSIHIFTHIEWHMRGYHISIDKRKEPAGLTWVTKEKLKEIYAVPTAFQVYTSYIMDVL